MTDYRVVPDALRDMATKYDEAGYEWKQMVAVLDDALLADPDLGQLGGEAGFITAYNETRIAAIMALTRGQQALSAAGVTLGEVAKYYEDKDFEFYKKFGYLKEELVTAGTSNGSQQWRRLR